MVCFFPGSGQCPLTCEQPGTQPKAQGDFPYNLWSFLFTSFLSRFQPYQYSQIPVPVLHSERLTGCVWAPSSRTQFANYMFPGSPCPVPFSRRSQASAAWCPVSQITKPYLWSASFSCLVSSICYPIKTESGRLASHALNLIKMDPQAMCSFVSGVFCSTSCPCGPATWLELAFASSFSLLVGIHNSTRAHWFLATCAKF